MSEIKILNQSNQTFSFRNIRIEPNDVAFLAKDEIDNLKKLGYKIQILEDIKPKIKSVKNDYKK